ncbi:NAD(P)-dependent oxidoreductase [Cellvibrio zantedeschiae]|uniref:dTDP-4-dehydrorhamnose reductase n=1 Tax=Cellvibrio zantedeschiae TaxID=1237077 RepID=A0ABQ3B6X1_9GAMM|nr:dTDP-4-dehydrorhamnose reductase [Cellvibrio zantedeschiae]GGY82443.1 NAD(P)-dependent oxidoreductase [Cellvibrio zantedeschiae]
MKVLITGANGQLGFALQKTQSFFAAAGNLELIALTRADLDLEKPDTIANVLDQFSLDAIINAAAYTAVDKAESNWLLAQTVNSEAVKQLAIWCEKNKKTLIHISTDFVFDGKKSSPYETSDQTNPLGVYGKTKQQGEQLALSECTSAYVVRTGWVYGEQGANFAKTILRLASEREQLGIVADQIGTPTYATHLAEMLWQLLLLKPGQRMWHFSDAGVASWYDFAVAIVEQAEIHGLLQRKPAIKPIATVDYPTPAQRPAFSVLDKKNTWETLNLTPVHWREALTKMLQALKAL